MVMRLAETTGSGPDGTCYDAVAELHDAMSQQLFPGEHYYVLGGIATGAIIHPDSVIDHAATTVVAAPDSAVSVWRDNDTKRDVDILVASVLTDSEAFMLKEAAAAAVAGRLTLSLFGVDVYHERLGVPERALYTAKDWTSRRTLDERGVHRYELFPLQQAVPSESYEPWRLLMPNGHEVQVLNPAAHMLAYVMRSVSGLRPKDTAKFDDMLRRVTNDPVLMEQIYDGPLRPWFDFAWASHELKNGRLSPDSPLLRPGVSRAELQAFGIKGRALHRVEGNPTIQKLAQSELGAKLLKPIVGDK